MRVGTAEERATRFYPQPALSLLARRLQRVTPTSPSPIDPWRRRYVVPPNRHEEDRLGAETEDVPRAHASPQGWAADYLAPSTFLETNFACANAAERGGLNFFRLCDATLERRIDRALALSPAYAAAAWAAAEHRLTDLAAAVPMTQRRAAVLVSRRVGNVQHHPQLFTLLDQMWVR